MGWLMSCVFACLGRAFVGKLVCEGPRVYDPDKSPQAPERFGQNHLGDFLSCRRVRASAPVGVAPEPPGGSGRTGREVSVLCRRVRASAPTGVAPEPPGGLGRTVWGVLFQQACVHVFSFEMVFCLTTVSLRSRGGEVRGFGLR